MGEHGRLDRNHGADLWARVRESILARVGTVNAFGNGYNNDDEREHRNE